ncbi:hypothetical protein GCM10010360_75150 [Streptomyces nogalater]
MAVAVWVGRSTAVRARAAASVQERNCFIGLSRHGSRSGRQCGAPGTVMVGAGRADTPGGHSPFPGVREEVGLVGPGRWAAPSFRTYVQPSALLASPVRRRTRALKGVQGDARTFKGTFP